MSNGKRVLVLWLIFGIALLTTHLYPSLDRNIFVKWGMYAIAIISAFWANWNYNPGKTMKSAVLEIAILVIFVSIMQYLWKGKLENTIFFIVLFTIIELPPAVHTSVRFLKVKQLASKLRPDQEIDERMRILGDVCDILYPMYSEKWQKLDLGSYILKAYPGIQDWDHEKREVFFHDIWVIRMVYCK